LTIYAIKALTSLCKDNEAICQYVLSMTFPLNGADITAPNIPKRSTISTLINIMSSQATPTPVPGSAAVPVQPSISDSLTISSCIASLCGSDKHLYQNVANQLLSNNKSTEAINRVCNYLREQQKIQQQQREQQQRLQHQQQQQANRPQQPQQAVQHQQQAGASSPYRQAPPPQQQQQQQQPMSIDNLPMPNPAQFR
jgi:hypothetical protein